MGFRVYNFSLVFSLLHSIDAELYAETHIPYLFAYYSKNNFHFILSPVELKMIGWKPDSFPAYLIIEPPPVEFAQIGLGYIDAELPKINARFVDGNLDYDVLDIKLKQTLQAFIADNPYIETTLPSGIKFSGYGQKDFVYATLDIQTKPIQLDMITPYLNIYTIPPFTIIVEQVHRLVFTLPMFQFQMSGEVHTPIYTDLQFTIPEIELDLWFGSYLGINVPTISLLLSGLETLRVRTLPPSISMEGTVSIRGRCEIDFTLPEVGLQAIPIVNSSLSLTLPRLLVSFGSNLALGNLLVRIPTLSLNAVQTFIETAILSLEVPLPQFNIQSSFDVIHSILNINIPLPYLLLIAYLEEILSDKVLVLNTVNTALSEYTNMPFAGAFRLGSKLYVCSSDGLYELSSNTDDGNNIEASASLPLIDIFSERVKRIAHVYLTLRGEGGKIIINDKYTYRFSGASRLDERRVKIGKGIKDRFIKITLANERGSVFAVDTMTIFADRETKRER